MPFSVRVYKPLLLPIREGGGGGGELYTPML